MFFARKKTPDFAYHLKLGLYVNLHLSVTAAMYLTPGKLFLLTLYHMKPSYHELHALTAAKIGIDVILNLYILGHTTLLHIYVIWI